MSPRRVVVAAPYPTMPGPEAAASFAMVRALVAAGDDVTIVSPAPSAAHHHADPGGPRGAARLARLASGVDLLHVRLDASALGAALWSPRLLPGRVALNGLLRRAREAEVRLDRVPPTVDARWATLVLGRADRVLVADEAARASLVAAGVAPHKVEVAPEPAVGALAGLASRRTPAPAPTVPATATAAQLQELVRRRAADDRAANRKPAATTAGEASLPLRHLVRMERAPVRSNKPGGAFVKRAIAKLLAWQFDNVIASVNRLHQATIEAVEALEAQPGDDTKR